MTKETLQKIYNKVQPLIERKWADVIGVAIDKDKNIVGVWSLYTKLINSTDGSLSTSATHLFADAKRLEAAEMLPVFLCEKADDVSLISRLIKQMLVAKITAKGLELTSGMTLDKAMLITPDGYKIIRAYV